MLQSVERRRGIRSVNYRIVGIDRVHVLSDLQEARSISTGDVTRDPAADRQTFLDDRNEGDIERRHGPDIRGRRREYVVVLDPLSYHVGRVNLGLYSEPR